MTSDLDHLFSNILTALTGTGEGKTSELERAKLVADLTECLGVYDTLCLWRTAENMIKRTVLLPYIKKVGEPSVGRCAYIKPVLVVNSCRCTSCSTLPHHTPHTFAEPCASELSSTSNAIYSIHCLSVPAKPIRFQGCRVFDTISRRI